MAKSEISKDADLFRYWYKENDYYKPIVMFNPSSDEFYLLGNNFPYSKTQLLNKDRILIFA